MPYILYKKLDIFKQASFKYIIGHLFLLKKKIYIISLTSKIC